MRTEKGYEPCCMTPTVAHTHATLLHGYPRDCLSRIALSRPGYPLAIRRDVPGAFHHESMFQTPSPPRRPTPTIPIGAIACMRETRTTAVPVLEAELNRCVHGREGRGAPINRKSNRPPHHHGTRCHHGAGCELVIPGRAFQHLKHAGFQAKTRAPQRGQCHRCALSSTGRHFSPSGTSGTCIPMGGGMHWVTYVCKGESYSPVHNLFPTN